MTKDELLKINPQANIKSDPLPDCPKCKGRGRIMRPGKYVAFCFCVQLGGTEDYRRVAVRNYANI